eukprot:CAMPEP_0194139668 /NCGR_PEP_ID=MMETSP0152-20130528/9276_1 /TAXON_ID=1049557 /ORGANISM="Thalassiothrix antarctica, Strain L6-D1" /LENGTH=572 /DNA_ID=CAMNT_0038837595 /DNA_START=69 /DNA_END=1787 /DNA_ORIENTATION=+
MWNYRFLLLVVVASRSTRIVVVEGLALPSPSSPLPVTTTTTKPTTLEGTSSIQTTSTIDDSDRTLNNSIRQEENDDDDVKKNDNDDDLEDKVIISIRKVVSSASNITTNPKVFFSRLGDFGQSSGSLIAQKWLTPEALEECTVFWDDGFRVLMRDLFRSYIFSQKSTRYYWKDWTALGWFTLLASSSSILFLPLLLPLLRVALEEVNAINESQLIPPSFRQTRLTAMRRLRRPKERPLKVNNGTPRNIQESISFFKDGTLLLIRDAERGTLLSDDDTWSTYGWFAFLAFSSFPLTPLIIPIIDKRREEGKTSDYVPSSYRPERLQALSRLRNIEAVRYGKSPVDTLRASVADDNNDLQRPPPEILLEAIRMIQGDNNQRSFLREALEAGRQWDLTYIAVEPTVLAENKRSSSSSSDDSDEENSDSWYRPLERLLLPWTKLRDGLYIDTTNVISANFDTNRNGTPSIIFQLFENENFQTTIEGIMDNDDNSNHLEEETEEQHNSNMDTRIGSEEIQAAFRSTTVRLGPFDLLEELPITQTLKHLSSFNFIYADDKVAVAKIMGGGIAVWTRNG